MSMLTPDQIQYQRDHINQSKVPSLIATAVICLFGAYLGVLLRVISRRILGASLKADDWTIILSLIFTTGHISAEFLTIRYGQGHHAVRVKNIPAFIKAILSAGTILGIALLAIKCSVLSLYHRIFPGTWFHRILWAVGIFVAATEITQIFSGIFQCTPFRAAWDPRVKGHCIDLSKVLVTGAAFDAASDFVILLLPMPKLWHLQISRRQKIPLIVIFLLGGVTCFASTIRAPKLRSVSRVDPSWSDVPGNLWGMIEVGVGTICACLPTLRPLFNHIFRRNTTPTKAKRNSYNETARDVPGANTHRLPQVHKGLYSSTTIDSNHPLVRINHGPDEYDMRQIPTQLEMVHIPIKSVARYSNAVGQDSRIHTIAHTEAQMENRQVMESSR